MVFALAIEVFDKRKAERMGKPGEIGFSFDSMTLEQAQTGAKYMRVMLLRLQKFIDEEEARMGLVKHGTGEVLPEPDDVAKTAAAKPWTPQDDAELAEENEDRPRVTDKRAR